MTFVVTRILGHVSEPRFAARPRDTLALDSEQARKRRVRALTTAGRDVDMTLPRRTFLPDGAVLAEDGAEIIAVERACEPAIVVRFDPTLTAAQLLEDALRIGHWAGNLHLHAEMHGDEVWIRVRPSAAPFLASLPAVTTPSVVTVGERRFEADAPDGRPAHA